MIPRGLHSASVATLAAVFMLLGLGVPPAHAQDRLSYSVTIEGVSDPELEAALYDLSDAAARVEAGAASVWQLRRRAARDTEQFLALLRSRGQYAATVDAIVLEPADDDPLSLRFVVEPGPVYTFRDLVIVVPSGIASDVVYPATTRFGLEADAPARAADILAVEPAVLRWLRDEGYPFPEVHPRRVAVDHEVQAVDVRFRIDPGRRARFGEPLIEGLDAVREQVVLEEIPWTAGDWYRQQSVNEARNTLYNTGLFAVARVEAEPPVLDDGTVPIRFDLNERKHRTFGLGAHVYTDEGALVRIRWEDRNRRGLGDTLGAELDLGTQMQRLSLGYQVRHFRGNRQTLNFSLDVVEEEREAFDSSRIGARAWLERRLTEGVILSYGIALRLDEVTQLDSTDSFQLVSFPVTLRVDRSNDLLNPTRGYRFSALVEPFIAAGGTGGYFLKTDLGYSHYWPVDPEEQLVIAGRLRFGSILGALRDDIPANERFYAGGGSSLRGYNYLTVSPLDDRDPIGGRSVLEASLELRRAITKTIGVVAFVDAGAAYDSEYPDFAETARLGAGLGLRYFSPIGPLRFDLAVPLNKRDIDDGYELYVSIGQAF